MRGPPGSDDGVDIAEAGTGADVDAAEAEPRPRRRRARARTAAEDAGAEQEGTTDEDAGADEDEDRPARGRRPRRSAPRGRRRTARDRDEDVLADEGEVEVPAPRTDEEPEEQVVEGVVELIGNGSGFLRVEGDDDVYVSAAQVRRCELVDGDRVGGPVRPPRRSERFPSLVRVDTINGRAADEVAEGTPFDELPATFPTERLPLEDGDATLKAIGWLTPLGRGSRATIVGPTQAGKSEALRRLARALAAQEGLEVSAVLAGVRPEELGDWRELGVEPAASLTLAASADARLGAIERAVETAKRIAARGGHAVLLIDSLEGLPPHGARKALAAARNVVDGGSLTIVAAAPAPVGGETTVVALDRALTATRRFPALDLTASGTMRAELLVGDAGADAIAQARAAGIR
jgi:transcription termination factor Rho